MHGMRGAIESRRLRLRLGLTASTNFRAIYLDVYGAQWILVLKDMKRDSSAGEVILDLMGCSFIVSEKWQKCTFALGRSMGHQDRCSC